MVFGDPNPTFDTVTVTGNGDSTGFSTPIGINDTGLIARGVDVEGTEIGVRGVATGGESLPVIGVWGVGAMGVVGQVSAQTNLPSNNVLPSVGVYGVGGPLPSLIENDLPYLAGVLGGWRIQQCGSCWSRWRRDRRRRAGVRQRDLLRGRRVRRSEQLRDWGIRAG
jgi:hypothetical protein